jgi:hypothetical protein
MDASASQKPVGPAGGKKVAPFAADNEGTVRKSAPGRSYAQEEAAKTTLFVAGNAADVRKSAAGDFFQWMRCQIGR